MANVYFGDSVSPATGNWNTTSNWYSSVGNVVCCCGSTSVTPGTPLGRLPNPASDTVYLVSQGDGSGSQNQNITLTTAPTGTYSGAIIALPDTGPHCNFTITIGTYSGSVSGGEQFSITGGTFSGSVSLTGVPAAVGASISGGTFTGTVSVAVTNNRNTGFSVGDLAYPRIVGGTFTGLVTRINPCGAVPSSGSVASFPCNFIGGGTYSPTATVTFNTSTGKFTGFPADPGFSLGGGTFSPTITISNLPSGGTSILGAGFP